MKALLTALLIAAPALHDYFVSICTVKHNAEEQRLQIVWRMTTHDLEHALEPETGGRKLHLGSKLELPQADSLLRSYLLKHLSIEMDGDPVAIEYLGRDVEMEDLYCYLQVEDVPMFRTITVKNTLLFDVFPEQENVVHLETDRGTISHSFLHNAMPHTFMAPE